MSLDDATQARLVGLFVAEAREALEALGAAHVRMAAGDLGEPLHDFGRTAHGLKGAAAALGFEGLARGLHVLEEVSLGLPGADQPARQARLGQLTGALALLEDGVGRMGTAGLRAFPEALLPALEAALTGVTSNGMAGAAAPSPPPSASAAARPAGAASAAPSTPRPAEIATERLSVPAAEVDEALRLAASLARAALQLHERLSGAGGGTAAAAAAQGVAARAERLEATIADLRLLPAGEALAGLEEEVAALAARLGRQVTLVVEGREVRADRRTLQSARGLVRHLVRNSLDHGLEPPEARRAAGKPAAGRLAVRVESGEGALRVTVEDDGAGFDVMAARAALVRAGADEPLVASLTEAEVLARFAGQGGSTRGAVTEVSGRGLGLSAVAGQARQAGGRFAVRSERGRGSAVTFSLPLEVYAVEVLVAACAGLTVGLPIHGLERTVLLASEGAAVHDGPAGRTLAVGESIVPLVWLGGLLGAPARTGDERFALVARGSDATVALAVDDVGAVQAVVPTTVPGVAEAGALVSGLARLADGTTVQVMDPNALVAAARAASRRPEARPRPGLVTPGASATASGGPARLDVVLAEDSLATREVLRVLLEEQGYRVRLAADGEEALARLRERVPDVLVTDINMPRCDGLSLTRALRGDPATARLAVILLTSQDDDATRAAGASAGADAYLVKSRFNAGMLADTLARIGLGPRR
jgi:two-component system, chemotaxis family, sensor kinase CheA